MKNWFDDIEVEKNVPEEGILVCKLAPEGEELLFPDNCLGQCITCDRRLQFRPHAPKLLTRMCDECAFPAIEAMAPDEVKIVITEKTVQEIDAFLRKRMLQ